MPTGRPVRFSTRVIAWLYRVSGGRFGGHHMLLLSTVGAQSGERRLASLRRFEDGPGRWLVVGSNSGAARQPSWLHNLARHPDQASIEVDSDRFTVTPDLLDGDERATAWRRIVAEAPSSVATRPRRTARSRSCG